MKPVKAISEIMEGPEMQKALRILDKLIEEAPEGDDSGPLRPEAPASLLMRRNGWNEKFIDPIELKGEKWLTTFERVKTAIAARGIVALIGERGPGKTQMAAEVCRSGYWPTDVGEWNGSRITYGKTGLYRRCADIVSEVRSTWNRNSSKTEVQVLDPLRKAGLLVIDEFQERGDDSASANSIITSLIDHRYGNEKPTILIANLKIEAIDASFGPSIMSRISENGGAFNFNWPSFRSPSKP